MHAQLGISLQLQIFGTGVVRCSPRGVFTFALQAGCSHRGNRADFSCSFCRAPAERCRQRERLGLLPLPSCRTWEIETGFGAEIWDLRHCPLLQDGFAQGCGRLG